MERSVSCSGNGFFSIGDGVCTTEGGDEEVATTFFFFFGFGLLSFEPNPLDFAFNTTELEGRNNDDDDDVVDVCGITNASTDKVVASNTTDVIILVIFPIGFSLCPILPFKNSNNKCPFSQTVYV